MKLHSPHFQKGLRRGVRKSIRRSCELKREYKASRKLRKQISSGPVIRLAFAAALTAVVWVVANKSGHIASALAIVTLWMFASVFVQAQRLLSCLYGSADLSALVFLPVREEVVFRWELQKFVRGSLWSLIDVTGAYTALAVFSGFSVVKWFAVIPLAILAWLELLALAALCIRYLPRLPYQLISNGLTVTAFVLFITWKHVGVDMMVLIDRNAPGVNLVLPTGWPALLFQYPLSVENWLLLGVAAPIGAVIWTLRRSLRQLRAGYQFMEPVLPDVPDLMHGDVDGVSTTNKWDNREPVHVGQTEIEEIIRSRRFLERPSRAERGRVENLLWQLLSQREKSVSEFVFPNGLNIIAPWRKVFRNLVVTCVLAFAVGYFAPALRIWILGFGMFVTVCQVLAQGLATGTGFRTIAYSGVSIPLYIGYAIGFRELARLLFKYSLVQFPLVAIFTTVWGTILSLIANLPLSVCIVLGIKVSGLILFSRFLFVTFAFSSCTNDTSQFRFRSAAIFLIVIVSCLTFLALGGAGLFVPRQGIAWLFWGSSALVAYGFLRAYGWFYHANAFDLMRIDPR